MYETFYGLTEKPFQIVPDPSYLYRSEKHENALNYLEYGLNEQVGLVLLTGEVGSGKTTLIQYLLGRLNPKVESAVIFNSSLTSDQLLNMVLSEFDFEPPADKTAALVTLNEHLVRLYAEGRRALLVVDEAQNLSTSALEELRMLSNLHDGQNLLLQVVLVGQQELKIRLAQPAMRQLAQRIAVRYHLTGLNREDTGRYIAHRSPEGGGKAGSVHRGRRVDLVVRNIRRDPALDQLGLRSRLGIRLRRGNPVHQPRHHPQHPKRPSDSRAKKRRHGSGDHRRFEGSYGRRMGVMHQTKLRGDRIAAENHRDDVAGTVGSH